MNPQNLFRSILSSSEDPDDNDDSTKNTPKIARSIAADTKLLTTLRKNEDFKVGHIVNIIPQAAFMLRRKMVSSVPEGVPLLVVENPFTTKDGPPNSMMCVFLDGESDLVCAVIPAWALCPVYDDFAAQKIHDHSVVLANQKNGADPFQKIDQALGLIRAAAPDISALDDEFLAAIAAIETIHNRMVESRYNAPAA